MNGQEKRVAYIFEDVGGWFICDDAAEMLDTRGKCYPTKNAAIAWLRMLAAERHESYTHYRTGLTKVRKLA